MDLEMFEVIVSFVL